MLTGTKVLTGTKAGSQDFKQCFVSIHAGLLKNIMCDMPKRFTHGC
jgi:hypothetical protein